MIPKASILKSTTSTAIKPSISTRARATKSLLVNLDDVADNIVPIPPDGGWGWVVVAASFVTMFCADGVGYCFAIFFQDISKDLNCKVTEVALSSAMLGGFYYLAGPLTCSAINRFGFQTIAVLGGVLGIIAFMTASFMKSVLPFTIMTGFFGGSAFNLLYTPSVIAIGFYFEKWRALAMAINCCGSSSGPLTCSAVNRFGFQGIAVLGGFVGLLAFASASYTKTVMPFTILVGFGGGSAFNLLYTPSIIAIGFYFEKWRALAMAITCCGSSLGVMCFPVIMTHFLHQYTWRIKFRILSGVFAICGLLGLTYKPIKATRMERVVQFATSSSESISTMENEREIDPPTGLPNIFQRFRQALFSHVSDGSFSSSHYEPSRHGSKISGLGYLLQRRATTDTDGMSYFMDPENKSILYPLQEEDEDQGKCKRCCRKCCPRLRSACCRRHNLVSSFTHVNRPMYRDDIFYTGSINLLSRSRLGESHVSRVMSQRGEPSMFTLSVTRAPTQKDLMEQGQCKCCPEAFLRVLATMLDFQMLKSPSFILLLISGYLSLMGTYIVYTYLVESALEMGIKKDSATLLLSILGIANTVGRATCGVVSCLPVDINIVSWICLGICGGITIASIYLTTIIGQIIFACVFGFTIATFAVLRAIMFVELFGIEKLTNCFGLNMIFQAAAAFSGVPIANYLFRISKNFQLPFVFTGAAITLSAILLIPVRCILRWEQKNTKK